MMVIQSKQDWHGLYPYTQIEGTNIKQLYK